MRTIRAAGVCELASWPGASGTIVAASTRVTSVRTASVPNDQRQSNVVPSHEPNGVPMARPTGVPTEAIASARPASRGGVMRRA
ncbi:unannotated protein [freshwater metagenome]|uniref:Unannotated protein n=1 Tax=freshwater metagenome TaxID=449393 RepID=A0A6J7HCK7_9ZZZZ